MNNEPVAWMDKRTSKCVVFINTPPSNDWIPLYTHPAKTPTLVLDGNRVYPSVKELTDEEILEIITKVSEEQGLVWLGDKVIFPFARAILRKAQEK
jgi:hypothetical protein